MRYNMKRASPVLLNNPVKQDCMTYEQLTRWTRLTLRRHYAGIGSKLLAKPDRRLLLTIRIGIADEFLNTVACDPYQREIIRLYMEGYSMDIPLERILERIEKRREYYWMQLKAGTEFNQPFLPVGEFVEEKRKTKILKFVAGWYVTFHSRATYVSLYNAIKKGHSEEDLQEILVTALDEQTAVKSPMSKYDSYILQGRTWQLGADPQTPIRLLYEDLLLNRMVDPQTTLAQFMLFFQDESLNEKIHWQQDDESLVYLVSELVQNHLSPPLQTLEQEEHLLELLNRSFVDKEGKPFSAERIQQVLKDNTPSPTHRIVDSALAHFNSEAS